MSKGTLSIKVDRKEILNKIGEPAYKEVFAHHITLSFGVEFTSEMNEIIGQKYFIWMRRRYTGGGVDCLDVDLPPTLIKWYSGKSRPHITISTDNLPSVKSNDLLSGELSCKCHTSSVRDHVQGVVEFRGWN